MGLEVDVVKLWYDSYLSWSHNKKQHNCGLKTFLNGRVQDNLFHLESFLNCFSWIFSKLHGFNSSLYQEAWFPTSGEAPEGGYFCVAEKKQIPSKMRGSSKWWSDEFVGCFEIYCEAFRIIRVVMNMDRHQTWFQIQYWQLSTTGTMSPATSSLRARNHGRKSTKNTPWNLGTSRDPLSYSTFQVWNAPTWFLSALSFALCALPYCLRVLATQKKEELRRLLGFWVGEIFVGPIFPWKKTTQNRLVDLIEADAGDPDPSELSSEGWTWQGHWSFPGLVVGVKTYWNPEGELNINFFQLAF